MGGGGGWGGDFKHEVYRLCVVYAAFYPNYTESNTSAKLKPNLKSSRVRCQDLESTY